MSAGEQRIEDRLHAALTLLKSGHLPGDPKAVVRPPRSTGFLLESAAHHSQFHAGQQQLPKGRVPVTPAPVTPGPNEDPQDREDSAFGNYYKMSANQKAFNEEVSGMYFGKNASPQSMSGSVVYPKVRLIIPASHRK